ncbi:hypothetical protein ACI2I2_19740 [Scandinavium sp. NPDC088450]|uniref:hypothetical protein n=1 Tax=Scandinavium sp. NPDC088450 TaxID=3364514 RepID=UPI00384E9E75
MLKYLLVVCFLFAPLAHSFDGFSVFYLDGGFHRIDEATDSRGKTTYTNEFGQLLGTSIKEKDGSTTYRNKYGHLAGTSTAENDKHIIYRGPSGDILGSATLADADGGAIYRDNDGNVLATASHD